MNLNALLIGKNIDPREVLVMRHRPYEPEFTGESRASVLWFELAPTDFYASWKGKLVIDWPPPERSWWRRAHRNDIPVYAILEDSAPDAAMPAWDAINLGWDELVILPARWRAALSQWRGIYYIYDATDGKGYVGSAYGGAAGVSGHRRQRCCPT